MAGQNVILMNQFTRTLLPLILKKPILRIVANHQRNLDALDVEGLIALERTFDARSDSHIFTYLKNEPTLEEWEAFVADYLNPEFQSKLNHDNPDPQHLHYYMMAYLLSGTFKDCSLMFKIGKAGSKSGSVTVIDMDPKSITRLKKWAQLDKEIAVAYMDEEEGRICFEHAPTVPAS
jgi:inositol-pentakisphosphate 2-kinase